MDNSKKTFLIKVFLVLIIVGIGVSALFFLTRDDAKTTDKNKPNTEVATYTVTLNPNGGSGGTASIIATYDSDMPSADAPTKTGYSFVGYYDAQSGGTQYYTLAMESTRTWDKASDSTLYAKWSANSYNVTLNHNGGSDGTVSVSATYHSSMPSATAPTKTGYIFDGYYDAQSGGTQYYTLAMKSTRNWNKDSDTTLYARWVIIQWKEAEIMTPRDTTVTATLLGGSDNITLGELPSSITYTIEYSGENAIITFTIAKNASTKSYEIKATKGDYTASFILSINDLQLG